MFAPRLGAKDTSAFGASNRLARRLLHGPWVERQAHGFFVLRKRGDDDARKGLFAVSKGGGGKGWTSGPEQTRDAGERCVAAAVAATGAFPTCSGRVSRTGAADAEAPTSARRHSRRHGPPGRVSRGTPASSVSSDVTPPLYEGVSSARPRPSPAYRAMRRRCAFFGARWEEQRDREMPSASSSMVSEAAHPMGSSSHSTEFGTRARMLAHARSVGRSIYGWFRLQKTRAASYGPPHRVLDFLPASTTTSSPPLLPLLPSPSSSSSSFLPLLLARLARPHPGRRHAARRFARRGASPRRVTSQLARRTRSSRGSAARARRRRRWSPRCSP